MNYADMLARKRMIREAVQEAADDATVRLRTDVATQKALWLAVCSAARRWSLPATRRAAWRSASCGNIRRSTRILTKYSDKVRRYLVWRYGITDREGKH